MSYAQGDVLELGVGTNQNPYPKKGIKTLTGVDWSVPMLEEAVTKDDNDMVFKIADVEKLPFEDESFDTVVDTFGLQSYYDRAKALDEMK